MLLNIQINHHPILWKIPAGSGCRGPYLVFVKKEEMERDCSVTEINKEYLRKYSKEHCLIR